MKVCTTISELREALRNLTNIGFVPTMGALHEGHASLLQQARKECATVVLSIFVNPTQFGVNEDLSKYPRQEADDLKLALAEGVDFVFLPTVEEMYPRNDIVVHVGGASEGWEGAIRPHHFDGVATIVAKLFNCVGPCTAYFGLKDLQQCAVVNSLVDGLSFPVQVKLCETVREPSGLAMSSRNAYLSKADKNFASRIFKALENASFSLSPGDNRDKIDVCLRDTKDLLESYGFELDYLDAVEPLTMKPTQQIQPGDRFIIAARWAGVRLIDNVSIS